MCRIMHEAIGLWQIMHEEECIMASRISYMRYVRACYFNFAFLRILGQAATRQCGASRVTYACKNKHYFEMLRSSRLHLWAEKFWKNRARFARRSLRSLASFS